SYNRVGQCRDSVIALTLSICPWALCIIVTGCPWQFSCLDKRHFITDTKKIQKAPGIFIDGIPGASYNA
ncbi:MAG: hypothetical protein IJG08_05215, partial [Oscillospiraceae bacterium]|nr:hypothetical protein [Oscillospiraceae bacterium]